jgi:hypothetical protein
MAKRVKKRDKKKAEEVADEKPKDDYRDSLGRFTKAHPYAFKVGNTASSNKGKHKFKVLNQLAKIVFEGEFKDLPKVLQKFPYLEEAIKERVLTWSDILALKYMSKALYTDSDSSDRIIKDILDRIDGKPISVIQTIDPGEGNGSSDSDRRSEIKNQNRQKRLKALTERAIREKADKISE